MKLPEFKNFTTVEQAEWTLNEVEKLMPELLKNDKVVWNSRNINHDDPQVLRLWLQMGEIRVFKHFIYPSNREKVYIHNHNWPSIIKCIKGGYKHLRGIYEGVPGALERVLNLKESEYEEFVDANIILQESVVEKDAVYPMVSPLEFHGVMPLINNSSLMIAGLPHAQDMPKSRKKLTNIPLTKEQIDLVDTPFHEYYC